MKCPIQCGQCCDYWRDVFPEEQTLSECPHIGLEGCKLPRSGRPEPCIAYLCGVARAVVRKEITHSQGEGYKRDCLLDPPEKAQ